MATLPCLSYCGDPQFPKKANRSIDGALRPNLIKFRFGAAGDRYPIIVNYQWDCDMDQWYPIHIDLRWVVQSRVPEKHFTLHSDRIIHVARSHHYEQNVEEFCGKNRHIIISVYPAEPVYDEFRRWYGLSDLTLR